MIDPATEDVICHIQEAGPKDVDMAVQAAKDAYKNWRETPARVRGQLMLKLAALIRENLNNLAALEALDNGKP